MRNFLCVSLPRAEPLKTLLLAANEAPGFLGFLLNTNLLPPNAAKVTKASCAAGNPVPLRQVCLCDQMIAATLKTVIVRYLMQRTTCGPKDPIRLTCLLGRGFGFCA